MRNEYATISVPFTNPDGSVAFANGNAVLSFYGFNDPDVLVTTIGGDIGILFAFACSFLIMFYAICEFYWK